MIDSFDIIFTKSLFKCNKVNLKKQAFLGFLISFIFCIFFEINPDIVKTAIISYLLISSFASFLDRNDIFMVYDDFRILDIDIDEFRFYKAYLIQRIIKDSYVMNLIFVILCTSFLLCKDFYSAIWFLIVILTYILLSPLNHIVGIKYNNMLFVKIILDLIISGIIIIGTVNDNELIRTFICTTNKEKGLIYILLFVVIDFYILFKLSKRESSKVKNYDLGNYYKLLGWLKSIDLELYKDYILNFQDIAINIINLIVFFYIMRDGFDLDSTYLTMLFIVVPTGLFMNKKKKRYKIIFNDEFFCSSDMEFCDKKYIKKKKLKTIMSEVIIKFIVCFILLIIDKNFNEMRVLLQIILISTIIAMIHFMIIIRNNKINSVYMILVKYAIVFLPMIRKYISISDCIYWGYLIIVGILTIYMTISVINEEEDRNEKIICNN